jgi:serpin B
MTDEDLLGALTRPPAASTGWQDVARIRRTVRHRRGRRAGAVALVAVAVAAALVVPRIGGGRTAHPSVAAVGGGTLRQAAHLGAGVQLVAATTPLTTQDPAAVRAVAQSEQAFTVALLKQLNSSTTNLSVSPASLAIALSMLQNGAVGATEQRIAATLRSASLSTATQNAGWAGLTAQWAQAAAKDKITLQSANSLWVQTGLPLQARFMADLAKYYATGVWQVDYARDLDAATAAINTWTKQQTHGKITKLFQDGQLTTVTVLVLANAVYFNAAWQTPFDPHLTGDGPFTLADGAQTTAKFMTTERSPGATVVVTPTYQAVQLPYTGGRFAALAVMPTGTSLATFTANLSPTSLQSIVTSLTTPPALDLSMPRFTTSSSTDLNATLRALGMPGAFTDAADFSALSPTPTEVQSVEQRIYLSVGEKGTEAAAATGISAVATSLPEGLVSIHLDHPFLFLVRDMVTGAILFASQINNPAG